MATTGADSRIRRAVILAGGKGTRLRPLTFSLPKALIPIGETPVIDIVLAQLERAGVEHVTIAAGHMAGIIMAYISSRPSSRMCIDFHIEDTPLGTAGPLAMIQDLDGRFFVLNGDLLTSMRFADLALEHTWNGAIVTIAACRKENDIPLGVLETSADGWLVDYHEKPKKTYLASMGIYAMEPEAVAMISGGERLDLPGLVKRTLNWTNKAGKNVKVKEFQCYWRDIGTDVEYEQAQSDFAGINPIEKLTLDAGPASA